MYKEGFKKLHATEGILTLYNEDATGMHIIINILYTTEGILTVFYKYNP